MTRAVSKTFASLALVLILVAMAGCSTTERVVGTLANINSLRGEITTAFGEPDVSVNVNNYRYLTVGLVNSKHAKVPAEEKRLIAKRVAGFAYAHYKSRDSLEKVNVTFVLQRSFLLFNYADMRDVYSIDSNKLRGNEE